MIFDIEILYKELPTKREFRDDLLADAVLSLRGVDEFLPFLSSFMTSVSHNQRLGEGIGVHRVLVGKPEGRRPLGRPRCRWEDNIKIDLQERGGGCGDWMERAQNRDRWRALVGTVMNFRVP
jgi:hypothetical protein